MNGESTAWIVGVAVAAVVGVLVRAGAALFGRMGRAESALREKATQADLDAFKREVSERYVTRDDWVPTMSRLMGMQEEQGRMLARIDERLDNHLSRNP